MMHPLFIKWTSMDKTGIPIIDEQHRGIVSIINSFFFHKDDPNISRILMPTAEMLKGYMKVHFLTEEQLMRESEYPQADEHIAMHEEMAQQVWEVEMECRQVRDALGFLRFLREYWQTHEEVEDKKYVEHIKAFFNQRRQ